MPKTIDTRGATWTYGVEHEFGDWDTRLGWISEVGFGRDPEPNICNSNGIAGDPTLRDYPFGGELNTPPTDYPEDQVDLLSTFLSLHPRVFLGHRAGLHVHIRVPGLRDSLYHLKKVQSYVTANIRVYRMIDPVPYVARDQFDSLDAYQAMRRWVQLIRKSHWTAIPEARVRRQMDATTLQEFLALEVPSEKATGRPLYHAQPRASVNLRQLLQTDTIEFRPFFQTVVPAEVVTAIEWCRDYLLACFDDYSAVDLYHDFYADSKFPSPLAYEYWRDKRWHATSYSKNTRGVVRENIREILGGRFDSVPNDQFSHLAWEGPAWLNSH